MTKKQASDEKRSKPFVITSVCRDDVACVIGEKKAMALSDAEMKRLAGKMADDYINQLFWSQIKIHFDQ